MLKLHVVIATIGRPVLVAKVVDLLAEQTRPADRVVVSTVRPEDVSGIGSARGNVDVIYAPKGLCCQRNAALERVRNDADIIVFFDDDFIPAPNYLENLERIFQDNPDIVGVTGELLADGILDGGFTITQAQDVIANAPKAEYPAPMRHRYELYGCNMAMRMSALGNLRFDEALPLYGWQEDIDFTNQLGRRGRQISTAAVTGVHMGVQGGRTSGLRLGYSQVSNIVYLKRKGTMRPGFANRLMVQNVASNLVRSLKPEPHIDRRGRLYGNILAIADCLKGKVDPGRILSL